MVNKSKRRILLCLCSFPVLHFLVRNDHVSNAYQQTLGRLNESFGGKNSKQIKKSNEPDKKEESFGLLFS
jgi:hypothetical protein